MNGAVLDVFGLSRRFGGLCAVDNVSLSCYPSQIHAVIGPNGAGKTTLINLLSGMLSPDSGHVMYDGKNIRGLPSHHISQLGIARSFQRTNIFPAFTVFENCRLAAQSRLQHSMRLFKRPESCNEVNARAMAALSSCGLAGASERAAGILSHGEQRQLEIAMTLVLRPRLLLLDEPLAGMGPDESSRIVNLLRSLRENQSILLVEHDMDAVFALADVLTVMVDGKVIAAGSPEAIRSNVQVQAAYLGAEVVSA